MTRKLASIRQIKNLEPIPGADAILVATVDDWKLVVKKTEFQIGDLCVYYEIDSFLPARPEYEFLRKNSAKKMDGVDGFRLRTVKLRGQISQGLALPLTMFSAYPAIASAVMGDDVTDILDVKKYEAPIPAELSGNVSGNFPSFIKKTDQERCQNLGREIFVDNADARYEVSIKLDGTSFTAFYVDGEQGVCSRNWELTVDEKNAGNTYVKLYTDSGLQESLKQLGHNIAIQGELMGPGIQHNREALIRHTLFVFDIYDINTGKYVSPDTRQYFMNKVYGSNINALMINHVPVLYKNVTLAELGIKDVAGLLSFAEGNSLNNSVREGVVFKCMDGEFSFKAISNKFLLAEKD